MRNLKIVLLLFVTFFSCKKETDAKEEVLAKVKNYSVYHQEAKAFSREENFNQDYYFLIDLSLHSGKNRFFVYDFKTKKIMAQNLVTHGSCDVFETNDTSLEKVKFSNENDSHCSSSGKYKIGKRDYSSWGINIKYWLHGLEKTNQNAEKRVVVLHSWNKVSNTEIYPQYAPLSWGCPAVSDMFMKVLDDKLQYSKEPVLLWIIQ
ncbi:peptidase [Flavobacterium sp. GA093]|uniref:Peptidase n=1 Tax=Flavobacterium hydrocarbonoxydans TaxID=2683249 RepID=A0A6I4NK88_9FLAO|nr:murein L,D-transpeptidase catalytic domain family protein [Flavobacterium hydrocarbonoxydans]MWB94561.1 peptidase [Flavobacterium hydrocarbonoxydans]